MDWSVEPGTVLGTSSPWAEHIDGNRILRVGTVNIGVTGLVDADRRRGRTALRRPHPRRRGQPPHAHRRGHPRRAAAPARAGQRRHRDRPHGVQLGAVVADVRVRGPVGGRRPAQRPRPEAAALRTDRCHRGRGHHLPPGDPRGGKNWDYRFAWVRDTAYTLRALARFGLREETHAAISWLLRAVKGDDAELRILYGLREESSAAPRTHDVPGWNGIGPVVTGNRAADQLQLGVYGDLLSVALAYAAAGNVLDVPTRRLVSDVADRVCDVWRQPDSGMWELAELRHHTSSKMGCWQALQAARQLAELGQADGNPSRWSVRPTSSTSGSTRTAGRRACGAYTMVGGRGRVGCVGAAARAERVRSWRADALHDRRAPPRAGQRAAAVPVHRRGGRRRATVRGVLVLAGGGARLRRRRARGVRADGRPGGAGQRCGTLRRDDRGGRHLLGQLPAGAVAPGPDRRRPDHRRPAA